MSIISFEDWKQKKAESGSFSPLGELKPEIAELEIYGFDLCSFITEETMSLKPNYEVLQMLWTDLDDVENRLPNDHAKNYIIAFRAFMNDEADVFAEYFDKFLLSEKIVYDSIPSEEFWILNFFWVFVPPYPWFYSKCSSLVFKHWPNSAMGWILSAMDMSEGEETDYSISLNQLQIALSIDPDSHIASNLIAMIYVDRKMFATSLKYFAHAVQSPTYKNDAAFLYEYASATELSGDFSGAIKMYMFCLIIDDGFSYAISSQARSYIKNNNYAEAHKLLTKAIAMQIDGSIPYRYMVVCLENQELIDDCIEFIDENIEFLGPQYSLYVEFLRAKQNAKQTAGKCNPMERPVLPSDSTFVLRQSFDYNALVQRVESDQTELFSRDLSVYSDDFSYGRDYTLGINGRIPLVLVEKLTGDLFCVEAMVDESPAREFFFLIQKINYLKERTGKNNVYGIVITNKLSIPVEDLLGFFSTNGIEVYSHKEVFTQFEIK